MHKKILSWLLVLVLALGLFTGCAATPVPATPEKQEETETPTDVQEDVPEETPTAPAETPDENENYEKEIVLAGARNLVPGLEDVYYSSNRLGAWEPLISTDAQGNPLGILATSWERNEDATQWTFFLREDVNFQNGEPLTADIVVENFNRYQLMETGKSGFTTFKVNELYPNLIGAEAVDTYTVKVSFSKPAPRILYNMKDTASCIFYPGSWDLETGYFTEQPVGTGFYEIKEVVEDEYVLLEAFDGYWGDAPLTKTIRIRTIPDPQTRYAALQAEEVMGVLDLGAMPAALAQDLLQDNRFAMASHTSTITHMMLLNSEDNAFTDVRLRQAVSMAIDREMIVDVFYNGYGKATQNLINQCCPNWVELPVVYDMDAAIALADEVLGGQRVPLEMYTRELYLNRYPYKETMEYIQAQLSQLGIDATIHIIDSATYSEMSAAGELGANFMTHGMSNLNPCHFMNIYMQSEGTYNKSQHLAYNNPEVDAMLAEMAVTLDDARFEELATQLQEIANEELPILPLFYDMSNLIYNTGIVGYEDFPHMLDLSHLAWA